MYVMTVPDPDEFKFYDPLRRHALLVHVHAAGARTGRPFRPSLDVHARRRTLLLRALRP